MSVRTFNLGRDAVGRSLWLRREGDRFVLLRKAAAREGDVAIELTAVQIRELSTMAETP